MIPKMNRLLMFSLCLFLLYGCAINRADIPIDNNSSQPGTSVTMGGQSLKLMGKPIAVGDSLPSVNLVDAMTMKPVDLSKIKGSILFLSIVPSIDTAVCEAQTHYLGEEGNKLAPEIRRIAVSRDTPFAQKRFAKEAKLEHIQFLSDYREGAFDHRSCEPAVCLRTDDAQRSILESAQSRYRVHQHVYLPQQCQQSRYSCWLISEVRRIRARRSLLSDPRRTIGDA